MPTGVSESTILNGGLFVIDCKCLDFFGKANNFFDRSFIVDTVSLLHWRMMNEQRNNKKREKQTIAKCENKKNFEMCAAV